MRVTEQTTVCRNLQHFREIGISEGSPSASTLLLEEITHRINNDLASTIAFIEMTAAHSGSEDVKVALAGVVQHVHEFANIQRVLRMPGGNDPIDAAEYLRRLCRTISLSKLQYRGIELMLREEPTELGAQSCWRMGMIVSELIANAARHAFEKKGGRILVELSNHGGRVHCTVTDSGCASENASPGHGSRIVLGLAGDPNGQVDQAFGPNGSAVMLTFPHDGRSGQARWQTDPEFSVLLNDR